VDIDRTPPDDPSEMLVQRPTLRHRARPGHPRPFRYVRGKSAHPPIAVVTRRAANGRNGPYADMPVPDAEGSGAVNRRAGVLESLSKLAPRQPVAEPL
jgi:hypothetical protein